MTCPCGKPAGNVSGRPKVYCSNKCRMRHQFNSFNLKPTTIVEDKIWETADEVRGELTDEFLKENA